MRRDVRGWPGRLHHEDRVDLALAAMLGVVVTVAGLTDVLGTGQGPAAVGWSLLVVVPLAVRRRFPAASWTAVLAVIALQATLTGSDEGGGVFLALLIGCYTVAAHTPRRTAVPALLALVPVMVYCSWRTTGEPLGDVPFIVALVGGFWVVGRVVRSRDQLVRRLEAQSEELRLSRDAEARAIAAEQRSRIARDVHDVVAHSVSLMVVQAEAGEAQLPPDAPAADCLRAIQRVGRTTMSELRGLLARVGEGGTSPVLGPAPTPRLSDLEALVAELHSAGLVVDLSVEGQDRPLPPGVDLAAYRILQEALTNALRHGTGGSVHARVTTGREAVVVEVVTRGRRPASHSTRASAEGRGLIGMQERARLYGGEVETGPTLDGFRVRARIPVPTVAGVSR